MNRHAAPDQATEADFNPLKIIAWVLLALLSIGFLSVQYANNVSIPRYCENPQDALEHLQSVITSRTPAGDAPRRPYLIAAKLLYIMPMTHGETTGDYLLRVKQHLESVCPAGSQAGHP